MKADPTDLTKLLDLQGLDTAIAQAKAKAAGLEVHQIIAACMKQRAAAADNLVAAKTALSDATAAADRAEADVTPVRERLARNQARVDAGQMDAKALSSAIDEIAHLKQRVSDLEDAELEAMEAVEMANAQLGEIAEQADQIDQELRRQVDARDATVAELAAEAKALAEARAEEASQIAPDLLALYDKIRARSNGIGIARFEGRRCLGCGLQATVTDQEAYLAAPADQVLRCAECDRILVR